MLIKTFQLPSLPVSVPVSVSQIVYDYVCSWLWIRYFRHISEKGKFLVEDSYHCNPVQGLELGLSGSFVKADPSN